MKDEKDKDEGQTGKPVKNPRNDPREASRKDSREDRLKLALRENLKRRKSQARGRSHVTMAPSNGDDVSPPDVSGKKPGE
jgi:hypothetical protein